jgi:tetratricopeptide (TPR) repeat protein
LIPASCSSHLQLRLEIRRLLRYFRDQPIEWETLMKRYVLAACAALSIAAIAPAHAQYTGGGSPALPRIDTMDPTALYNQAVDYISKNDFARAVPLLREVLAKRDGDPAANLMMGVAQIGLNDLPEARRFLARAVSEKPDLADAIGRLGWVEARLGNADAAGKQRATLASLKAKCNGACAEAAAIDTGLTLIDSAGAAPKVSIAARFNQGVDHLTARNWSGAVAAFNDVLAAKPDDYEAAFMKGQALTAAGELPGAKAALELALKLQPGLVEAKGRLGWIEKKLGNADAAATYRAELVTLKEKNPSAAATIDAAIRMLDAE